MTEAVRMCQEKHKTTVHLLTDENEDLQALHFQDEGMKKSCHDCPKLLFADTIQIACNKMACFLVIVKNGNGDSKTVVIGLFATGDADTDHWFFIATAIPKRSWLKAKSTKGFA